MLKSSINLLHTVYAMHKTSNSLSIKQETNKNQNSQQGKVINIMDLQFINQLKDSCSYILLDLCVINTLLLYLLQTFSVYGEGHTVQSKHFSEATFGAGRIRSSLTAGRTWRHQNQGRSTCCWTFCIPRRRSVYFLSREKQTLLMWFHNSQ